MRRSLAKVFSRMLVKMTHSTIVVSYNRQIPRCRARCCLMKIWVKEAVYIILISSRQSQRCLVIIKCLCQRAIICYKLYQDLIHRNLNSSLLRLSHPLASILSMGLPKTIIKFCLQKRIEKFPKFLTRYWTLHS